MNDISYVQSIDSESISSLPFVCCLLLRVIHCFLSFHVVSLMLSVIIYNPKLTLSSFQRISGLSSTQFNIHFLGDFHTQILSCLVSTHLKTDSTQLTRGCRVYTTDGLSRLLSVLVWILPFRKRGIAKPLRMKNTGKKVCGIVEYPPFTENIIVEES